MNQPLKYRKKPVVVEAMQVHDDIRQNIEIQRWAESVTAEGAVVPVVMPMFGPGMIIHTLRGTITANIGDYIIRRLNGEFYKCREDIFEATYEQETK